MFRSILILGLGLLAQATIIASPVADLIQRQDGEDLPIVTYDGPLYRMSPEEYKNMTDAMENGDDWFVPDEVPRVEMKPGMMLDLGGGTGTSLEARSGYRQINVYFQRSCPADSYIGGAANFGCGGVCIFYNVPLLSAWLGQQFASNPKPTANMYPNRSCGGSYHQKIGIWSGLTQGCSNADGCCGSWQSFYAYYDC
ncbi:hypothetical protein NQ176_g4495 [Zarea fungicola]|uniref:Uncharacterized protein n=1 Tax=Zarea fungicola TaxID=93591 RepID=A0ACC1ND40_9HYPO|nr:hypothetical protein NQ176_g4495 [Lecanicillium fungicola]